MKDKFKERIEQSREEWDHHETDLEALWDNIETKLDEKENSKTGFDKKFWLKIAASITLLFTVSWIIMSSMFLNENSGELYALRDLSPELAETEYYYSSKISEKLQLIRTSDADVDIDKLVLEDLNLLDSAYYELQEDLKDNVDNEEVINAMIQNYRIKLQILEKVLDEIRTQEQNENSDEITI